MKKPIKLLYTDKHLNFNNFEIIKELTIQEIELAKKLKVDIIGLGDELVSRQSQPLSVLDGFGEIHKLYIENNINRTCLVGNHCKVNYTSEKNYLNEFKYHPNIKIIDTVYFEDIDDIRLHYVAYFDENVNYKDYLQKAKDNIDKSKMNILLTHALFNGGVNNNKDENKSKLELSDFKEFDKVLSGHIHDKSKYKNFYYIGSIRAANFGENNGKGFTILYDDGSHELIKSTFPKYETIKIDLDKISKKDLNKLITSHGGSDDNIRFKFIGSEEKIKSIKKEEFSVAGIDVLCDIKDIEYEGIGEIEHVELTKETIKDEFKDWCEKKEKDYDIGIKYINKKFKE